MLKSTLDLFPMVVNNLKKHLFIILQRVSVIILGICRNINACFMHHSIENFKPYNLSMNHVIELCFYETVEGPVFQRRMTNPNNGRDIYS